MDKKLLFGFLFLFLIGFVAAHGDYDNFDYKEKFSVTKYYPDENLVLSHTAYVDYENDNRYSTYDYHNGYSYRSTSEYWEDHHNAISVEKTLNHRVVSSHSRDRDYHKYVPRSREHKKRDCYHEAPRNKLFYIKC